MHVSHVLRANIFNWSPEIRRMLIKVIYSCRGSVSTSKPVLCSDAGEFFSLRPVSYDSVGYLQPWIHHPSNVSVEQNSQRDLHTVRELVDVCTLYRYSTRRTFWSPRFFISKLCCNHSSTVFFCANFLQSTWTICESLTQLSGTGFNSNLAFQMNSEITAVYDNTYMACCSQTFIGRISSQDMSWSNVWDLAQMSWSLFSKVSSFFNLLVVFAEYTSRKPIVSGRFSKPELDQTCERNFGIWPIT